MQVIQKNAATPTNTAFTLIVGSSCSRPKKMSFLRCQNMLLDVDVTFMGLLVSINPLRTICQKNNHGICAYFSLSMNFSFQLWDFYLLLGKATINSSIYEKLFFALPYSKPFEKKQNQNSGGAKKCGHSYHCRPDINCAIGIMMLKAKKDKPS